MKKLILSNLTRPVVPAIIPTEIGHITDFLHAIGSVPEVHLDVCDGQFVPTPSWPYMPDGQPSQVGHLFAPYTLEVDLMTIAPLAVAPAWVAAGADMLVFHIETIDVAQLYDFAQRYPQISIGVCALNDTPIERLYTYAEVADYVQVMGIAQIGAQGQAFDERLIERVRTLHATQSHLMLSVDGSVNQTTIATLAALPIDRFVVGSAITKAVAPRAAYEALQAVVSSTGR